MEMLRQGSRLMQVRLLQRLLNKKHNAHRFLPQRLTEDSIFGAKTHEAVTLFQRRERLPAANGIADQQTWQRLGVTIEIDHFVILFPQPTGMTCWSAAATMVDGSQRSIGAGNAALGANGGMTPSFGNIELFARSMGWRMYGMTSWSIEGLANLMRRVPLWSVGGGGAGGNRWLHATVLSGMWSDGQHDGTLIRIHDPWPPGVGRIWGSFYDRGNFDGYNFSAAYLLQPPVFRR